MEQLQLVVRYIHIIFGTVGLIAFWFPVLSRKGGILHRRAGQVFRYNAYIVLGAAGLSVILHMVKMQMENLGPAQYPGNWAFLLFLGYLALITAIMLHHGLGVLRHKPGLEGLNTPWRRSLAYLSAAASLFIIGWALYWQPPNAILLYALSPLGLMNGIGILRILNGHREHPRQWLTEHLGAMLGCGIAYHTAFFVFGASRLFSEILNGWMVVLPWILPALIGIPAIVWWSRRYRQPAI
ncbi:MAG: hypothetical protein Tsb002_19950 [Wenzhouxiangellaceae bacterium]